MFDDISDTNDENIDYISIDGKTIEVADVFNGNVTLKELVKNALQRDAEAVLRELDNN